MKLSYTCKMSTSAKTARGFIPKLAEFSVEGTVPLDYRGHYTTRVLLPSGQIIGCEQNKQAAPYLLAGAPYRFVISPGKIWSHELRSAVALQPDYRVAQVSRITCTEGGLKDLETVTDLNEKSGLDLDHIKTYQFELSYSKSFKADSIYLGRDSNKAFNERSPFLLEAYVRGKWQVLYKGANGGLRPLIPATSRKFRLTISNGWWQRYKLTEITLFHADSKFITAAQSW